MRIAKRFIALPDAPLMSVHSTYLAPYYSATSQQGLTVRLSQLVNAVADAPAGDVTARQVIDNVEEWADRSEERREGKECVSTFRSRGCPYHQTTKNIEMK